MSAIIGHAEPIAAFRAAMHGERLHHAWLLTGPEGVGKFSLAMQFARRLLAEGMGLSADTPGVEVPLLHPAAKLLDAWSHPDFALLDRLPKDDKLVSSKPRNDWRLNGRVTLGLRSMRVLGFSPSVSYSYSNTKSSLTLYQADRSRFRFALARYF